MALIKCSECGKEFSDKANACPNCACPVEKEKIKVKIYNKGGFTTKCSVSIDNLPVGQLGGMMLGKQKDIEISLPIGTHYIGVSTQIEHGGQITGVVGVGQEQDGKQFEIATNDKYLEIEIVAKGSFTGTSGRYCVGNIKHYNSKELKTLQEQEQNIEKEKEQKRQIKEKSKENTINFFKKYRIPMIVLCGVLLLIFVIIIVFSNSESKYYGRYTAKYDDMGKVSIELGKDNLCIFTNGKRKIYCSYSINTKDTILEITIPLPYKDEKIWCGRFTTENNSSWWSCKSELENYLTLEKIN